MINIGITGTGSLIGQAVIKCIKKSDYSKDYRLIGFDYFKDTVGSFWCHENYILPDILNKELIDNWLASLIEIIKSKEIRVLFPGVDFELELFAKHKKEIENKTGCIVVVSSLDAIRIGNDKYLTYQFLKENKLFYPKTYLPENYNLSEMDFPVIVKPRVGAGSIGVSVVKSEIELTEKTNSTHNPIIQELVGADNDEFTCGVIAFEGDIKQTIVLNRSLKNGDTFISEYRKDFPEEIYSYIQRIAKNLNLFGVCNFQLRLDSNGTPKLFEINPRHSGTTFIRSLFGYNEIIFILKYILDSQETKFDLREGRSIRYFEEIFIDE